MDLAVLIGNLIRDVITMIVDAAKNKDVDTMRKVQDILPPGSSSALELVIAMEEENLREEIARRIAEQGGE